MLDLYVPRLPGEQELPLLIWTSGSAWFSDNGKAGAAAIADEFNPRGYAVAGVSVRSSFQVKFPGQLFDIRAAIRWLRSHAEEHNIDPDRIAIMGNSSGGWVSAIAATTSDILQLDGEPDVEGVSSAVQASVPFFPPTALLRMDQQTLEQKETYDLPFLPVIVHDAPFSPESNLIGCPIQTCPEATEAANPIRYVNGLEPPIHVFHGTFDPLLPARSERGALRSAAGRRDGGVVHPRRRRRTLGRRHHRRGELHGAERQPRRPGACRSDASPHVGHDREPPARCPQPRSPLIDSADRPTTMVLGDWYARPRRGPPNGGATLKRRPAAGKEGACQDPHRSPSPTRTRS